MTGGSDVLDDIRAALAPHGIFLRGCVRFSEGEEGPSLTNGRRARSVVLLGNIGGSVWEPFSRWREDHAGIENPLDEWSKSLIRPLAARLGATAYFPSDPPWQPFQQWAMRAEGLRPSPLGILIHPVYGLWHGYRGALGLAEAIESGDAVAGEHPCDRCRDKPCLTTCPAGAISAEGFDVGACRSHLRSGEGRGGCLGGGCLARAACPVGLEYRYPPAQLGFHMAALDL